MTAGPDSGAATGVRTGEGDRQPVAAGDHVEATVVDPGPGVGDRDLNIAAGFHFVGFDIAAVQNDIFRLQK